MIRQSLFLAVAAMTAATTPNATANTDPFLEQDGRLVVEVEGQTAQGGWSLENTIEGHTGAGYLVWKGTNNYAKSQAPNGNPIQYHVRINTPGNYELRWRSRNTVGLDATEHNDSWVRFPSGRNIEGEHALDGWTKAYMGQVSQWTWDAYTVDNDNQPIRQYFDAGDHVVEIAGRSNGHGLDRFALFRYEQEQFDIRLFDALSPSPRASESNLNGHRLMSQSCIGNNLSLAAESVVVYPDTINLNAGTSIQLESAQQTALLQFNIPQLQAIEASIKLANNQATTDLSVYLGSHSDWTPDTPTQNLPYASLVLGNYQSDNSKDQIQSIYIDPGMVMSGPLTIALRSESGLPHRLYGVATVLEPRLDLRVSETFCATYRTLQAGTQLANSPDPDSFAEENAPASSPRPDIGHSDDHTTGSDTENDNSNSNSNRNGTDAEIGFDTDRDTGEADSQSPFDVVDTQATTTAGESISGKTTRKGGALSFWVLVLFVLSWGCRLSRRKTIISFK